MNRILIITALVVGACSSQAPKKPLLPDSQYSDDLEATDLTAKEVPEPAAADPCAGLECDAQTVGCTIGYCDAGVCKTRIAADSTPCDDGDACTGDDACDAGVCAGVVFDCSPLDDECNVGACDTLTGLCAPVPKANGTTCNDDSLCTSNDTCTAGRCGGDTLDCSASASLCNAASCDPATGCTSLPLTNTECDDSDPCTVGDSCTAGLCQGAPRDCSVVAGPCGIGVCIPANGGCAVTQKPDSTPCSDGSACTLNDTCTGGNCIGTPKVCPAANCNLTTCDGATGACGLTAATNGTSCIDGDNCTEGDHCEDGTCVATPKVCDVTNCSACNPSTGACVPGSAANGTSCDVDSTDCQTNACQGGSCVASARADCATCGSGGALVCRPDASCGPATLGATYHFDDATLDSRFAPSGVTGWSATTTTFFNGEGALQSGAIANGETSGVDISINARHLTKVSFWVSLVSSVPSTDALVFTVDGVEQERWQGNTPWTKYTFWFPNLIGQPPPSAPSHVELTFMRGASGSTGLRAAFIDDLVIEDEAEFYDFATLAPFQSSGSPPFTVSGGAAVNTGMTPNSQAVLTLPMGYTRDVSVGIGIEALLTGADSTLSIGVAGSPPDFTFTLDEPLGYYVLTVPAGANAIEWRLNRGAGGGAAPVVAIQEVSLMPAACP